MRRVTIDGREYELRYTLRSLFVYEQITGKTYKGGTLSESYLLLYATLCACNKDMELDFDKLIDACDADASIFSEFLRMLEDEAKRVGALDGGEDAEKKKMSP